MAFVVSPTASGLSRLGHGLPLKGRRKNMPLINIVVALVIVGVVLYLINRYIPMASSIKSILNIVVVVAVGIWVLQVVGLWGNISSFRVGH
jgi:predicted membrane protein